MKQLKYILFLGIITLIIPLTFQSCGSNSIDSASDLPINSQKSLKTTPRMKTGSESSNPQYISYDYTYTSYISSKVKKISHCYTRIDNGNMTYKLYQNPCNYLFDTPVATTDQSWTVYVPLQEDKYYVSLYNGWQLVQTFYYITGSGTCSASITTSLIDSYTPNILPYVYNQNGITFSVSKSGLNAKIKCSPSGPHPEFNYHENWNYTYSIAFPDDFNLTN